MECGEPSPGIMEKMLQNACQLCGRDMQSGCGKEVTVNYQKRVDPPRAWCEDGEPPGILPDPVPQPPDFFSSGQVPTITHTPVIEYRVVSDVRGKPANQTGVTYIMNHSFMDRADVEAWIRKKKQMAEENVSWVGDGTYVETHPNMLSSYGKTTHLFMPNPEKPFGDSPPPRPVCKPRDGLDH